MDRRWTAINMSLCLPHTLSKPTAVLHQKVHCRENYRRAYYATLTTLVFLSLSPPLFSLSSHYVEWVFGALGCRKQFVSSLKPIQLSSLELSTHCSLADERYLSFGLRILEMPRCFCVYIVILASPSTLLYVKLS